MRLLAIVFLSLVLLSMGWAADSLNVTMLSYYQLPGIAEGVAVSDSFAYLAAGPGLWILDITNPAAPSEVCFHETGVFAMDVTVDGNHAYTAEGLDGLRIIDITDPAAPVEFGVYDTPGQSRGVAVSGNHAYVADWTQGLRIIDISNPAVPVEVGFCDTPGGAIGVEVRDGYAYVADILFGLRIIDVSDPAAPTETGFYYDTPGYVHDVAVSGQFAYLASSCGLRFIDMSDPTVPWQVGVHYDTLGLDCSVALSCHYAAAANCYYAGIRVIDIVNPVALVVTGFYYTGLNSNGIAINGSIAYVAQGIYLCIYDISAALATSQQPEVVAGNFRLHSAYPNPFNATTQIRFDVPRLSHVTVAIYDLQGRLVETIASRLFAAGTHRLAYDASRSASGVYFVSMQCGEFSVAQKIVLLR